MHHQQPFLGKKHLAESTVYFDTRFDLRTLLRYQLQICMLVMSHKMRNSMDIPRTVFRVQIVRYHLAYLMVQRLVGIRDIASKIGLCVCVFIL